MIDPKETVRKNIANCFAEAALFWHPRYLIYCGTHRTLKNHLKHFSIWRNLVGSHSQFQGFLLHVFNSYFNWHQNKLESQGDRHVVSLS